MLMLTNIFQSVYCALIAEFGLFGKGLEPLDCRIINQVLNGTFELGSDNVCCRCHGFRGQGIQEVAASQMCIRKGKAAPLSATVGFLQWKMRVAST